MLTKSILKLLFFFDSQIQEVSDYPSSLTPDWDKHSSSSEMSVACLQDKIIQMEETHYSTNEELQATLQELADLQTQLSELQHDNERLNDEKDVLFQSLCRQTEKLEDSRSQLSALQELLLRDPNPQDSTRTDREQNRYELQKTAQQELEALLLRQEELGFEVIKLKDESDVRSRDNSRLKERVSILDSMVDAGSSERKQIELLLNHAKEDSVKKQIEISRLTTLLENARAKIDELEQDRSLNGDKSDLSDMLDVSRKEKDTLEIQVASLQEQLSKSQCEIEKYKDLVIVTTEDFKVARNNAKSAISDLEYKLESSQEDKKKLTADYQHLQEATNELKSQCKSNLEDVSRLKSLLTETQRHLGETERMLNERGELLCEEQKQRKAEVCIFLNYPWNKIL